MKCVSFSLQLWMFILSLSHCLWTQKLLWVLFCLWFGFPWTVFFLIFSLSLMSFNVLCVYVETCVHLSLFLIVFVLWSELSYCSGIVHNSVINYPHILSLFFFPSNIAFYREFNIFDLVLSRLFFLLVFVSSVNLSGCLFCYFSNHCLNCWASWTLWRLKVGWFLFVSCCFCYSHLML